MPDPTSPLEEAISKHIDTQGLDFSPETEERAASVDDEKKPDPASEDDDAAEDEEEMAAAKKKKKKMPLQEDGDADEDDTQESQDRRFFPKSEKDKMDDSEFGDPVNKAYPIKSPEDVINAAMNIGRTKGDKNKIKARIKSIAKRKGYPLPKAWQDEGESGEEVKAEKEESKTAKEERATSEISNHASYDGSHKHVHMHGDTSHSHDHAHDSDSDHHHSHPKEAVDRAIQTSDRPSMYMPFIRVDAAKREVIGQATAEIPDSYGTIFAYYPKAWEQWRGNIREQHDPKKAVGKRIQHFLNPTEKSVDLHVKVSRGAQDTWMKVEDDVLTGFSLSVIPDPEYGNNTSKWPRKQYEGRDYAYLPRYTIAEVSLVDNPSCPNCNIQIVRSDGFATDVLDLSEDEQTQDRSKQSESTHLKMHKGIAHTLHSAVSQMENCNCPTCQKIMRVIDPDNDGDIDLGSYDDPDHSGDTQHDQKQDMERVVTELIERSIQPIYSRLSKIAGSLSKTAPDPIHYDALISAAVTRAFDAFDEKLAVLPTQSSLDEVRAELSAVKGQVDKIADQPMPGGPIMNASSMPMPGTASLAQPVEKRLPTDPPLSYGRQGYGSVYDAIATMSRAGKLDTTDKQVDAVAEAFSAQRRR